MKRNIYLAAILVASSGFGVAYLNSNSHDDYTPRTEEEKAQNVFLTSKERSIKGALEYYNLVKQDINTGEVPADAAVKAVQKLDAMSAKYKQTLPLQWTERGPNNVGGRTRAVLVDRNNNQIMYCGGVSGGVFKSTNRAKTWSPVGDELENMIVTSITQTPDGVIYIGTGEEPLLLSQTNAEGGSGFIGNGMYRSEDGGETWDYLTSTNSPFTWRNTPALASDNNTNRIYAGNTGGVYWSEDKGENWTKVTPNISAGAIGCRQVLVANDGTVYAHIANKVYKSANGKTDYVEITPSNASTSRFEIAVSHEDPNYVYMIGAGNDNRMSGVWRSTNKGDDWEQILGKGDEFFDPCSQLGTTQGQGLYDLCISVAPYDKDRIFLGGVQLATWKKGEGESLIATTFNQDPRNSLYVHADKHKFVWDVTVDPPVMWIGSDGGVAVTDFQTSSTTGRPSYTHMSKGLNIYQSFGIAANEQRHVVSGSQDNGNQLMNLGGNNPLDAVEVFGGDGFQNEYSRLNPRVLFVESQYGNIARSQNDGETFSSVNDGRLGANSAGSFPFNTQFRLWESLDQDSINLFAVSKLGAVFISPNAIDFSVNPIFYKVSAKPGYATEMEFSPDGDVLYYGTSGGQLYRLSNLLNATYDSSIVGGNDLVPDVVEEQLNVGSGLPSGRAVMGIGQDPEDADFMVVVYGNYNSGNHVYLSTNASDPNPTFTSIQGNLPDMPVYDIQVIYTGEANPKRVLIIGTEFGVFASDNDGASWTEQNDGLARVPVFKVRAYMFKPWEGYRVYLGTHGRGVYESYSLTTSVKDVEKANTEQLVVYPNPANTYAKVKFNLNSTSDVVLSVVDIKGRVVISNTYTNQVSGENEYSINTSKLPAGTYFVRVETPTQKGYSKLLVVK